MLDRKGVAWSGDFDVDREGVAWSGDLQWLFRERKISGGGECEWRLRWLITALNYNNSNNNSNNNNNL